MASSLQPAGGSGALTLVHIPKTAGTSLIAELQQYAVRVSGSEACFKRRRDALSVVFLRSPPEHVVSQFMMLRSSLDARARARAARARRAAGVGRMKRSSLPLPLLSLALRYAGARCRRG